MQDVVLRESGGFGSIRLLVGLNDPKGFSQTE